MKDEKSEAAPRAARGAEKSAAAQAEEETLAFWEREHIFEKTLLKPAPKGDFVFYEGPPTANGKPGIHHLESRAFKDALPRYKTMRGYRVHRRAGWDTHGLPVELEVEKELGFKGKPDIEKYGVAPFNEKCRASVLRYIDVWEKFTKRIGYWVDETRAYFTFDAAYMEALWHVFKHASADDRLYKDYKVVPWCPRCGTALSAHELAQGYADVKDLSVTVKFKVTNPEQLKLSGKDVYLLAWTTTPWTLPGNVALAVNPRMRYGVVERGDAWVIAAMPRFAANGFSDGDAVYEFDGRELVGLSYEPLYDYARALAPESEKPKFAKAYQVHPAAFVTTEDGTGIVHTAVMYGQDDFTLGSEIGLPKVHLVNPDGTFVAGAGAFAGRSVVDEDVAVDILKDLAARGLLFSKAKHEHSYPFCWRCKTRLIYYARDSWYLRMQDVREEMVRANGNIRWEPGYIRDGRMGEWLQNAKDWAISRERYWGTPMPVWQSADSAAADAAGGSPGASKERMVIGSVEELRAHTKTNGNTFFVMRHGEAKNNVARIVSRDPRGAYGLTEEGKKEVAGHLAALKAAGVTKIFASPVLRAQETARIVSEALGVPVTTDERLTELGFGEYEGRSYDEFLAFWRDHLQSYHAQIPGGESYQDAKQRFGSFIYDIERMHQHACVLVVTHGIGLEALAAVAEGAGAERSHEIVTAFHAHRGELRALPFVPLPHNARYELDLHRPYIDDVVLVSEKGTELRRVVEVLDVWFDSGAMPFAQGAAEWRATADGRAGSLTEFFSAIPYPADFISEAIDQTRGWFYTLLAVGTLMGRGAPYKNVICLGHILDANGQKMSKSRGNGVDPWAELETWGVDTLRFWMYTVSQPGDSKNYDEKTVREASKTLSWLENSAKFYELFAASATEAAAPPTVLDRWMHARMRETVHAVTEALETYRPFEASRALTAFAEDLSQWYVRRVRDRARAGDPAALATLRDAVRAAALLCAPFTPFLAERLFNAVKTAGDPVSVHLADWPHEDLSLKELVFGSPDDALVTGMKRVRALAADAHQLRQKAGVKVRQPLAKLSVPDELPHELAAVLAEEVNVKKVITGYATVELDTTLTDELIAEGDERAFQRAVAEARKAEGFSVGDSVEVVKGAGPHTAELSTGTIAFSLARPNVHAS